MRKNIVDRTYENSPEDPEITVTLSDGYRARFWLMGLSDAEYIKRTIMMRKEERDRRF